MFRWDCYSAIVKFVLQKKVILADSDSFGENSDADVPHPVADAATDSEETAEDNRESE